MRIPSYYSAGQEIVPGFRLESRLGHGGFGEVWKANGPGGTHLAIKIVPLGERLGLEEFMAVRLFKSIRHPNLVPIIAFWLKTKNGDLLSEAGDSTMLRQAQDLHLILAMGLGDKNLLQRLYERQRAGHPAIERDELLNYMEDAARAIDYLNHHPLEVAGNKGIQHCDIKPQNILIVGGAAEVCDFGLARMLGSGTLQTEGSAAYMAPELIQHGQPSPTTDQYSLAVSYVELRTGSLPANLTSPAAAIWTHIQGKLDLSHLPDKERDVIRRATALDPERRYSSAMEMVRELRQAAKEKGVPIPVSFPAAEPEAGREIVPGYKLIRCIGRGTFGEVWHAIAPGGMPVALKIIRNLDSTTGRQEFHSLACIKNLEHNHLLELYAYWLIDGTGRILSDADLEKPKGPQPTTLVIASRLASKNLLERLRECQRTGLPGIPPQELLRYMRQAASALDHLNAQQHPWAGRLVSLQHCNIKPENLLLSVGVVKIGDFGLAKVVEDTTPISHDATVAFAPAYAAPERFSNQISRFSDQYSLAITYFKLRTGELPFPPGSPSDDYSHCHQQGMLNFDALENDRERAVLRKATALKPEERYPTCTEMVRALCEALGYPDSTFAELLQHQSQEEKSENELTVEDSPAPAGDTGRQSLQEASTVEIILPLERSGSPRTGRQDAEATPTVKREERKRPPDHPNQSSETRTDVDVSLPPSPLLPPVTPSMASESASKYGTLDEFAKLPQAVRHKLKKPPVAPVSTRANRTRSKKGRPSEEHGRGGQDNTITTWIQLLLLATAFLAAAALGAGLFYLLQAFK